ncbi:hypothetical protein [Pseudonocardia asaccharolytica]|uniref:Uncharacterized protein n=1 Tax=Pseudonocardia asaccharolytica DSM 44247 = NBRC 16224 TaxID=1123024 RepID=A0A511D8G5_9PSEU|nr:hypothetical protein [Pseudonocardia asaccharolytica]GEL19228.1 hypothetical protein PA7_30650 [Pseudonocardia asaccharolytica DSM 44247 = NBRC 16224]
MSVAFHSVVSAPPSGRGRGLILDHHDYAQAVILQGKLVPWDDVTRYTRFLGQAQGLLRPDTTLLDLGAFYAHAIGADPALVAAMSARSRTGYALKTLLAHEATQAAALEFASVVAQSARQPLVAQVPSPLRWLATTHRLAGAGDIGDITADHGENMAVYVADWLRRFATLPVSLLLLDGRRADLPGLPAEDLGRYSPIGNAAEHYRWTLGCRRDGGIEVAGGVTGVAVPAEFWLADGVEVPAGDFLVAEIPAAAEPETVLKKLAELG